MRLFLRMRPHERQARPFIEPVFDLNEAFPELLNKSELPPTEINDNSHPESEARFRIETLRRPATYRAELSGFFYLDEQ